MTEGIKTARSETDMQVRPARECWQSSPSHYGEMITLSLEPDAVLCSPYGVPTLRPNPSVLPEDVMPDKLDLLCAAPWVAVICSK